MGRALGIGRLFGIQIRIDLTWFIVFFLITSSLSTHYFPTAYPGWLPFTYLWMGAVATALFFAGIVAHELAHSLVSQAVGVPVRDITLFIFGGIARIMAEPRRARDELGIALAGPGMSLALAGLFGLVWGMTGEVEGPLQAVAGWLTGANLAVGLFNLIPGFPLDGGRALRALVWGISGDLRRATHIATGLGQAVSMGFIFWGIMEALRGNWADGLWIMFIGWFLGTAAAQSAEQFSLQQALAGQTAHDAMLTDCPTIPRWLTLDVLVHQVVIPSGRHCFPVVENGALCGLLTLHGIKAVPRDRWPWTRVEEVMIPGTQLKTVKADDDLSAVLSRMGEEQVSQYPVIDNGHLVGVVARDEVLKYLHTRKEMGLA